jgi:surface protein
VATISGSTVTIVGFGSTTITATQAAFGIYGPGSISTTFIVYEDAIELASNGVTYRYKKASAPSGTSNPYITIDANGTVFAVMRNSQDSINKINAYAKGTTTGTDPFNYNGTLIPFNRIVTTLMTDMNFMLANVDAFNGPIGSWDTSNVLNMSGIFTNAVNFNQPIGNWNMAKVTNMSHMFSGSAAFNQPIGNWDTVNVTDMRFMFFVASNFNQNISGWNVTNVSAFTSFRTVSSLTSGNTPSKFVLAGQ